VYSVESEQLALEPIAALPAEALPFYAELMALLETAPWSHSQLATTAQGDLSHSRPSRATHSLTEGDLIIGKDCKPAVGTLVERTSRYLLLLHLPDGRDARLAGQAIRQVITSLPGELARAITWDQGKEMACHAQFTIATGIPVYFCDPHKPWQRGSNENTNGLLRQYLPKGTDLSVHSAADIARIAASLNGRPRKPSAT